MRSRKWGGGDGKKERKEGGEIGGEMVQEMKGKKT